MPNSKWQDEQTIKNPKLEKHPFCICGKLHSIEKQFLTFCDDKFYKCFCRVIAKKAVISGFNSQFAWHIAWLLTNHKDKHLGELEYGFHRLYLHMANYLSLCLVLAMVIACGFLQLQQTKVTHLKTASRILFGKNCFSYAFCTDWMRTTYLHWADIDPYTCAIPFTIFGTNQHW